MSHPRDLLGQISRARADMMLRGYAPLVLEMGPATARVFRVEAEIADIEDWLAAVMDMPLRIRSDMEGFAIRPETA